ncbi:Protein DETOXIFICATION [Heracleum sosnowskyi]|uniref:Protein DETOXIFICATION n=1 Tax=Heracleum sosnowskyi TaxID=360622 RepID=A0AAD8HNP5_9APIA|nr:Protein DETOXIFICATION [Heracleum sosnowskyi]
MKKATGHVYALKKLKISEMLRRGQVEDVKAERNLLAEVPYIKVCIQHRRSHTWGSVCLRLLVLFIYVKKHRTKNVLYGMASALETLCGQAHGAKQHKKLSSYTYGAIICLLLFCIPVAILWIYMEKILILIHQDPLISREAGKFSIWSIPALFSCAILQPLVCYLQSQYLVLHLLASSVATLAFHVPNCWAFVFKFKMGSEGAALAIGLSYWFNAIFLGLYAMYSLKCAATRAPISMEVFSTIKDFLCLGIPSALMVCLEWWAYEVVILLAGIMKNPQLETSVLSISITVAVLHYFAPFALGVAASIRVSNELGAGNPKALQMTVWVVLVLGVIEVSIATFAFFSMRHVLGRAFVSDNQIVDYVRRMTPFICLTMILDSIQGILSAYAQSIFDLVCESDLVPEDPGLSKTITPIFQIIFAALPWVEYEKMPGWQSDVSSVRNYSDLPKAARDYVERIEELVGVPVHYIGIGPGRDALIYK